MPVAGSVARVGLPEAGRGQCRGSGNHGADRPAVPGAALLRLAADGGVGGDPRPRGKPQTGAAAEAGCRVGASYQRPNTSKSAEAHKIYPYLLGGMAIERVNQVWCADVTYIPMPKGFLYLVVIMDWVSRAVLAWRLSNTLGPDFCLEALEEALARDGRPEICKIGDERRTAFRRSVSRRLFPVGSRTGAPV